MKLALCIGLNDYPGFANDLSNCVHDARDWGRLLEERGFWVRYLLDSEATRDEIRSAAASMAYTLSEPGDEAWITFSGHGTWEPDVEPLDEADARDEAICAYDGNIRDDDIHVALNYFGRDVRLTVVSDSCHSGGVARAAALHPQRKVRFGRFLAPERGEDLPVGKRMWAGETHARRVVLTGCDPLEYSYDGYGDEANGAFTAVALRSYEDGITYREWHSRIRELLPTEEYPQSPQLEGDADRFDEVVFGGDET